MDIDQRAARVAGVDVCVGLYEVPESVDAHAVAARGTDYGLGHGLTYAERIADREYKITNPNRS